MESPQWPNPICYLDEKKVNSTQPVLTISLTTLTRLMNRSVSDSVIPVPPRVWETSVSFLSFNSLSFITPTLILKSFDNQTESWNPVSNDLIIRSFDILIDNQRECHVITFTKRFLTNQTKQTQTTVSTDWFLRFLLSVCSDPSSGVHKRSGHHHLRHQKPDHLRLYLLTF